MNKLGREKLEEDTGMAWPAEAFASPEAWNAGADGVAVLNPEGKLLRITTWQELAERRTPRHLPLPGRLGPRKWKKP